MSEEQAFNEEVIEVVMERITKADDIDDQVEREIRRYWGSDRVAAITANFFGR